MRVSHLCIVLASLCAITLAQTAEPADPYAALKQRAGSAVAAERAREKLNPCHNSSGPEQVLCPSGELDRSTRNYLQLTSAIVGLLRVYEGNGDADDQKNEDRIAKDFNVAESAWSKYRQAQCETLSSDLNPDDDRGHLTSATIWSCKLAVTRQHIYELNAVYDRLWSSK